MNLIKKCALSVLAGLPIASVSFAAVSKLTELEGMKANEFFKNKPPVEPIIETEDPNELAA
ncbi:MAG: hypothetical protein HY072_06895, partial [Deltaproteobacteria bacterium]|nr:hypothetical protein [Deltaproteobacteria bacterium]